MLFDFILSWVGFLQNRHWDKDLSVSSLFARRSQELKWGREGKPASMGLGMGGGGGELKSRFLLWALGPTPWSSQHGTETSLGLLSPQGTYTPICRWLRTAWGRGGQHLGAKPSLPVRERPPAVLEVEAVRTYLPDRKCQEDTAPAVWISNLTFLASMKYIEMYPAWLRPLLPTHGYHSNNFLLSPLHHQNFPLSWMWFCIIIKTCPAIFPSWSPSPSSWCQIPLFPFAEISLKKIFVLYVYNYFPLLLESIRNFFAPKIDFQKITCENQQK